MFRNAQKASIAPKSCGEVLGIAIVKGQKVSGSSLKPLPLNKDEMGEKVQESQVLQYCTGHHH